MQDKYDIENKYFIVAAAFEIDLRVTKNFVHDFWCMMKRNGDEVRPVAQLHGLAFNENDEMIPIGYAPSHKLKAVHLVHDDEFAKDGGFEADRNNTQYAKNFSLRIDWSQPIADKRNSMELWKSIVS